MISELPEQRNETITYFSCDHFSALGAFQFQTAHEAFFSSMFEIYKSVIEIFWDNERLSLVNKKFSIKNERILALMRIYGS